MTEKLPDRRIAKTRAALGKALFALMKRHAWEDISIQALCDEANVARSSFYAHYETLVDLLDDMISINLPVASFHIGDTDRIETLEWLVDHIAANRQLFSTTVSSALGGIVLSRFKNGIRSALRNELQQKGKELTGTQLAFLLGGTFEAIQEWSSKWRMERVGELKAEIREMVQSIMNR